MNQETHTNTSIQIANEDLQLLSDKAIYLPAYDMLAIADLHLGKVEHFRKNGIGVPNGASTKDLERLKQLILKIGAKDVIFMGDLFHSDFNNAWLSFQNLIQELKDYRFHLIMGNHDIMDKDKYENLIVCHQMELGNLILTHEPLDVVIDDKYNLCGHIHPGVKLRGRAKQNLRMPCFYFGKHTGILPAFGSFTGLHVLKPLPDDQVFVVNGDVVMKVN